MNITLIDLENKVNTIIQQDINSTYYDIDEYLSSKISYMLSSKTHGKKLGDKAGNITCLLTAEIKSSMLDNICRRALDKLSF